MRQHSRHIPALVLVALAGALVALCAFTAVALAESPLPPSNYTVRAACPAPSPGHASCLALQLVPITAEARAHDHPLAVGSPATQPASSDSSASEGAFGLTPADLHTAYQLPTNASTTQTVAVVDAYNDPTAASDLKTYDEALGLPACTIGNGCLKIVNQNGETGNPPFPKTSAELEAAEKGTPPRVKEAEEAIGWDGEISLDIQTVHAVCQNCKILLVEASNPSDSNLEAGERAAEQLAANEISNSWGGPEFGATPELESTGPFNHPHTVITASAGDDGYLEWAAKEPSGEASFPASSPHVVSVGGTRLLLNASGHTWSSETVWNDGGESAGVKEGFGAGGGGCSTIFEAPPWQSAVTDWTSVGCASKRAVADVAADADPYTGVAVHDTSPECGTKAQGHWCTFGGTSLASPIIASVYALAGGAQGVEYPAQTLYKNATARPASLHDVFSGSNGECQKPFNASGTSGCTMREEAMNCSLHAICQARSGYDGPSGLGTPHGIAAFELAPAAETTQEKAEYKAEVERQATAERKEEAERDEEAKLEAEAKRKAEVEQEEATRAREATERREAAEREKASGGGSALPTGPALPASVAPSTPLAAPVPAAAPAPPTPQLSSLALTLRAVVALNARRPRIVQVAFAFTLNTPIEVRVTLAKRVRVHRRTSWQPTRGTLTFGASSGRNSRHLGGSGVLAPGLYRLSALPLHGTGRSVLVQIG